MASKRQGERYNNTTEACGAVNYLFIFCIKFCIFTRKIPYLCTSYYETEYITIPAAPASLAMFTQCQGRFPPRISTFNYLTPKAMHESITHNTMLMKHSYNQFGGGIYAAPEIEIYEMPAESGFAGSVESVGINNWGEDEDSLQF